MGPIAFLRSHRVATLLLVVTLIGCATTRVTPITGADFKPDRDEIELWERAEKIDDLLHKARQVYDDQRLNEYLDGVANRLLPHFGAGDVKLRIRVLRDPFLNAFALPNGLIYLHAGILGALDNEAQVATVLGHEIGHFLHRHMLRERRTEENRLVVARIVVTVLAIAVAAGGSAALVMRTLELGGVASRDFIEAQVAGYARDLEREADESAVAAIKAAGYDPTEAVRVFETLKQDSADENIEEPYVYGRHPPLDERIASTRSLTAALSAGGTDLGADRYAAAAARVQLEAARLNLAIGRPRRALAAIDHHLRATPDSVDGLLLLGEAHRRVSDQASDLEAARDAYARLLRVAPRSAAGHREMGLLARQMGDAEAEHRHLLKYLELEPQAPDRSVVEGYLSE